jgi:hypothetical protein
MTVFVHESVLIARSLLLMIGVVCVNLIVMGGFQVMLCSGRDDDEHHGMGKITSGIAGSLTVAALFAALTVVLQKV